MKKIFQLFFIFTAFLFTNAYAITVTETTDFSGSGGFNPIFTSTIGFLDPGINTVSGSLAGDCVVGDCNGIPAGDTQDSFILEIASGFKIDSLFVTTSNVNGPAGFSASFNLLDPSFTSLASDFFLPLDSTTSNLITINDWFRNI